jgi:NTP-dependent ternary system trypsin peptidase co-occuring protein
VAAYVDLPIDDDETIRVEISDAGLVRAGAGDVVATATERLDQAIGQVVRMGRKVIEQARAAAESPDAIELELGLKLTAKTGFVVAQSSGEAHVKVILKWTVGA